MSDKIILSQLRSIVADHDAATTAMRKQSAKDRFFAYANDIITMIERKSDVRVRTVYVKTDKPEHDPIDRVPITCIVDHACNHFGVHRAWLFQRHTETGKLIRGGGRIKIKRIISVVAGVYGYSLQEIANYLGYDNHTTILNHRQNHYDYIETNADELSDYNAIVSLVDAQVKKEHEFGRGLVEA